jgi:REP element-mobilizing transposase RayT
MARKVRIQFEGAVYHVMDRGDRSEDVFIDDRDRVRFLKTLDEVCCRTGWRVHSYVLMRNHYHLLIETPEANLVAGMQWFQTTVTIRHNARHRVRGHLFQGRYKAIVVDPEAESYFITLSNYIHLNPVRARILGEGERLESYPWSSFPGLIGARSKRERWLEAQRVLGCYGCADDVQGRGRYESAIRSRVGMEQNGGAFSDEDLQAMRKGWCFGSETFRNRMLTLFEAGDDSGERSADVDGGFARDHGVGTAAQLVLESLKIIGLKRSELDNLLKNDPRKIAVAILVKSRTVVSNRWLADELRMGSPSRVSRYCGEQPPRERVMELLRNLEGGISGAR